MPMRASASVDTASAIAVPGVLAVLTGRDLIADGLNPIPHKVWSQHPAEIMLREHDGFKTFTAPHYPLPADKARFVGETVAMVVAETVAAAKDGAERVAIDYEPLPAVTDTREAARPDAPRLFDEAGSNVVVDGELGDRAATEAAFARAAHVVQIRHLGAARHRRADGAARRGRANSTRPPGATRFTPAMAAPGGSRTISPAFLACRPTGCA